jgi:hypothetical protein
MEYSGVLGIKIVYDIQMLEDNHAILCVESTGGQFRVHISTVLGLLVSKNR